MKSTHISLYEKLRNIHSTNHIQKNNHKKSSIKSLTKESALKLLTSPQYKNNSRDISTNPLQKLTEFSLINNSNLDLQHLQTYNIIQGKNSTQGLQGYTGPQGLQGYTGSQGLQGKDGTQGLQGYTGSQGSQGYTGPQGLQGYTGPQGLQGYTGTQGLQGLQGLPGHTGPQGLQGHTGLQGPQGLQGKDGSQGLQGHTGLQGLQGHTGLQGLQGHTGLQGLQGHTGLQGLQGKDGPQGLQGHTGIPGKDADIPSVFNKMIRHLGNELQLKAIKTINSSDSQNFSTTSCIIGGNKNKLSGNNNIILGSIDSNIIGRQQVALGGENLVLIEDDSYGLGHYNYPSDYQLTLGNGTSLDDRSNSISVSRNGIMTTNKIHLSDHMLPHVGIYYESNDGNKIPYGTAVIFEEGTLKIRPCLENETPIGVIVPTAYIIYGTAEDHWVGKHEKDNNGEVLMEFYDEIVYIPSVKEKEVEIIEEVIDYSKNPVEIREVKVIKKVEETEYINVNRYDESGKIVGEEKIIKMVKESIIKKRPKVSNKFNSQLQYIPRSKRNEWNIIAVSGLVKLNKNEMINLDWTLVEEHDNFDYYLIK